MNIELIRIIVEAVLGCTTLLGFVLYHNANRRVKNAEALDKEIEADSHRFELYEQRLEHCNQTVETHNETIAHQSETIAALNKGLDDKTARIRQLTDDLYESEKQSNRLNDRLVDATERIGQLQLDLAKYKDWHCRVADCPNRLPPNPRIKGRRFDEGDATDNKE